MNTIIEDQKNDVIATIEGWDMPFVKGIVIAPISLGSKYQKPSNQNFFKALLEISSQTFGSENCHVVVCDVLQAYTKTIKLGNWDRALEMTKKEGEKFFSNARATKQFVEMEKEKRVTNWGNWLHHAEYKECSDFVDNLFASDKNFKEFVNSTIQGYFERLKLELSPNSLMLSTRYILEECKVMFLWAKILQPKYILYAGEVNDALQYITNKYIRENYGDIMYTLLLKYSRPEINKA
jgi:hypothetical protein